MTTSHIDGFESSPTVSKDALATAESGSTVSTSSASTIIAGHSQNAKKGADEATPDLKGIQGVSAMQVAWQFVMDYYTYMYRFPQKLYCFYGADSQLTSGLEGVAAETIHGKYAIREFFESQGLIEMQCKVLVQNIDCQCSSNDGMVIFVSGLMTNQCLAEDRKFSQTFVLAPQSNGYYILNDMLRYHHTLGQPGIYKSDGAEMYAEHHFHSRHPLLHPIYMNYPMGVPSYPMPMVPMVPTPSNTFYKVDMMKRPSASEGVVEQAGRNALKPEPETQNFESVAQQINDHMLEQLKTQVQVSCVEDEKAPLALAEVVKATESVIEDLEKKETLAVEAKKPESSGESMEQPKSWAVLANKEAERWGKAAAVTVAGMVESVPLRDDKPVELCDKDGPQVFNRFSGNMERRRNFDDHPFTAFVTGSIENSNDAELAEIFSKVGTVLQVHIPFSKKCAFVKFETADELQAAIEGSFKLPSGDTLIVEERRQRERLDKRQSNGFSSRGRGADRRFARSGPMRGSAKHPPPTRV